MRLSRDTVTVSASGRAAPALAWRRYEQVGLWTSWAPHLTSVSASADTIADGVTGRVTALWLVPADFRVTAVDRRAMRWSWTVSVGPLRLGLVHAVEARPDGGATTWATITGPWPVPRTYAPVARLALTRLVAPEL